MESIQHLPKGTPIAPSLSSTAIGVTFGLTTELRPGLRSLTRQNKAGEARHALRRSRWTRGGT